MLTTLLVHASGEWVSSLWPVCPASETSAHIKGAALIYARRYALLTLVGIAGEDDLGAPDIPRKEKTVPVRAPPQKGSNGSVHAPPTRDVASSADLRDRLLQEIAATLGEEALAVWAKRAMPLKNQLTEGDAWAVEATWGDPRPLPAPDPGGHRPSSGAPTQVTSRQNRSEDAARRIYLNRRRPWERATLRQRRCSALHSHRKVHAIKALLLQDRLSRMPLENRRGWSGNQAISFVFEYRRLGRDERLSKFDPRAVLLRRKA
jgi:hypothetical protein